MVWNWLNRASVVDWTDIDPRPIDISDAPLEIKMIHAFAMIEYNISNGGWAQFLWNCFDDWRGLIEVARDGYRLIGAVEQHDALGHLHALCSEHERECDETQQHA